MTFWQFLDKHADALGAAAGTVGLVVFLGLVFYGDAIVAIALEKWRRRP